MTLFFRIPFFLLLFVCTGAQAQVLYREDFSSVPLSGGVAHLPAGFSSQRSDVRIDLPDYRNVPFNDTAYADEAWAVRTLDENACAVATAAVQPSGAVDRWLFLPVVTGNTTGTKLEWRETSYNAMLHYVPCSYEVWITTDTSGPPSQAQFTATTSNRLLAVSAHATGMYSRQLSLGTFSGGPFRIAFRLNEVNIPAMKWQLGIDDITIYNAQSQYNLAADDLFSDRFVAGGDSATFVTLITNVGNGVSGVQWNIRLGSFEDSLVIVQPLNSNQTLALRYSLLVPALAPGEYYAECWLSHPNGNGTDAEPLNDTIRRLVQVIAVPVNRNVLVEEFTGAWCGDCPEGSLEVQNMMTTRPWLVPVAIHTSDSMTLQDGEHIAYSYSGGYPSLMPDRRNVSADYSYCYWADYTQANWGGHADKRHQQPSVASVSVLNQVFDWNTRIFSVDVEVTFLNNAKGPFALNCWLTEDNVFGPPNDTANNGWNNRSYFNNDTASVFFGMGDWLDPSEYVHNHVLVKILSGSGWGDTTLIPDSVAAGNTFGFTFQDTLPMASGTEHIWIPQDIHVVAFLALFSDYMLHQEVVNASSASFNTSVSFVESVGHVTVYPNPTQGELNLKIASESNQVVDVELVDVMGRSVSTIQTWALTTGENVVSLNAASQLAPGMYYVRMVTDAGASYVPFVVAGDQ